MRACQAATAVLTNKVYYEAIGRQLSAIILVPAKNSINYKERLIHRGVKGSSELQSGRGLQIWRRCEPGDGLWQLIETKAATMPAAHCHGMFDSIFEFPNVPRPEISLENIHDVRVEIKHHRPHLQGKPSQEVPRQRFDIARAFPQGRNVNGNNADTVIEILAELAIRDHLLQVAVGGSNQAHIDGHVHGAAQRTDDPSLENL